MPSAGAAADAADAADAAATDLVAADADGTASLARTSRTIRRDCMLVFVSVRALLQLTACMCSLLDIHDMYDIRICVVDVCTVGELRAVRFFFKGSREPQHLPQKLVRSKPFRIRAPVTSE